MNKKGWNDWIFNSIDWDSQAKALSKPKYTQEQFITKWAHNLLPTRRHMKQSGTKSPIAENKTSSEGGTCQGSFR
jgi:hypothetical protein